MWRAYGSLLLLLWLQGAASAQEICPWLTEGTAAALLDGPVTSRVHGSAVVGDCEFVRQPPPTPNAAAQGTLTLSIAVGKQKPKECLLGEPAKGVGEDSMFCAVGVAGEQREVLRGRVRSTWFLLTLTARGAAARDKASLRRSLEQAGEEVAGSLF